MVQCSALLRTLVLGCLLLSAIPQIRADDDVDGEVEDDVPAEESGKSVFTEEKPVEEDGTEVDTKIGPSPDAQTSFIFTQPESMKELLAGKLVKFLMGLYNRGDKDFIVSHCETSFRYPQDFNYYIQNFTLMRYNRLVAAKQEASFEYAFLVSEQFAERPVGFVVELVYKDTSGKVYRSAVYNETIKIVEDETNFNTETGFLYLLFTIVIVLVLLAGQHFLSKLTRKHGMAKSRQVQVVEMGTTNRNEVDFEWIPREVINHNKSPKPGSPRQRKAN